jgi:hypothetical protein
MSINSRLARLEREQATDGLCPHGFLTLFYTQAETPAEVAALDEQAATPCAECGRLKQVLEVRYTDSWRAGQPEG